MKNIQNIDAVYSILPDWRPTHAAYIKHLSLHSDSDPGYLTPVHIEMSLLCQARVRATGKGWPDFTQPFKEVKLLFRNVFNVQLHFGRSSMHQIMGFDIIDTSDRGLEHANFEIEDYENDSISFGCKTIEVVFASDTPIYFGA